MNYKCICVCSKYVNIHAFDLNENGDAHLYPNMQEACQVFQASFVYIESSRLEFYIQGDSASSAKTYKKGKQVIIIVNYYFSSYTLSKIVEWYKIQILRIWPCYLPVHTLSKPPILFYDLLYPLSLCFS